VASTKALQVNNYSKYHLAKFNEAERKERREKVFPKDCWKAYNTNKALEGAESAGDQAKFLQWTEFCR